MTRLAHSWPAPAGRRLQVALTLMLGSASLGIPAHADPNTQARAWAAACTGCHNGADGAETPAGMKPLAGANRDAMLDKLLRFKAGQLPATVMQQLTQGYEDAELRAIADYFSRQQP